MPDDPQNPRSGPSSAAKKPDRADSGPPRAKSAEKEARLAEALRANLRRRKAAGVSEDKKDD